MSNVSYHDKAAALKERCRTPGRVVGCEKLVELLHHPERMAMDMPQFETNEVSQVTNQSGKVVETVLDVPAKTKPSK